MKLFYVSLFQDGTIIIYYRKELMKLLFSVLVFLLLLSCNTNTSNTIREIFKPKWEDADTKNLPVQFGDVVRFTINDTLVTAIILDFKDEGDIWIGMCFIKENNIFGRQIPRGYSGDCMDLLDFTYLNSKALNEFKKIRSEKININKIGIGSESVATSYDDILRDYKRGLMQRKKKQTPCNENISGLDNVYERYFDLNNFK